MRALDLTQLPDLPPRPETPRNVAFRRFFYSRWGKENWIVCGPGRHAEYLPYKQTFSIKTVLTGREHYCADNRRLTVTDETYLLLNEDRTYGSLLEAPQDAFSFSIFFRPGLAARLSHFHFLRLFRQVHGVTPMTYLRAQRARQAAATLA